MAYVLKANDVFQDDFVIGKKSTSILRVQKILKNKKYSPGPVDGIFGPMTKSAVAKFQRDHGWRGDDADGFPGPSTVAALGLKWHGPRVQVAPIPVPAPKAPSVTATTGPTRRFPKNLIKSQIVSIWKNRKNSKYAPSGFYNRITSGMCLWFAQELTGSGHRSPSARVYGKDYIKQENRGRHYNLEAGCVIILDHPRTKYGHAVASVGGNQVLSTDFPVSGRLRLTTIQAIEKGWGMTMVGYIPRKP